jgi:hypothetical protein
MTIMTEDRKILINAKTFADPDPIKMLILTRAPIPNPNSDTDTRYRHLKTIRSKINSS